MKNVPELRFAGFDGEWEESRFETLINNIGTGSSKFNLNDIGYPILGSTGIIGYDDNFDYEGNFILIARVGANAGSLYNYNGQVKISDNTIFIETKNQNYVYNLLINKNLTRLIFGSGQPLVKSSDLKTLNVISTKNKEEQEKIGDLFKKIDILIENQEDKVSKMEDFKKSMLQKTFPKKGELVPEFRFDGFDGDWICSKSGNVFELISEKDFPDLDVLSATQDEGMILRNDFSSDIQYDKNQLKNYKKVEPGDFVIHLRSFQGGFAHSSIEGITSPAYSVIRIKDEGSHFDLFWKAIFSSQNFINILQKLIYGVRDGKSISFKDFKGIKLRYPTLAEQEKIGNFFKNLDAQIETEKKLLESYKMMKKSLLQKMFV